MSIHLLKIVTCLVCINLSINAEIPLTEIHGMSTCMKPGYELFSPAVGALYWYSPYVRNLYEFGDQKSAIVHLAKQLFNINIDGSFDISYSALQITRYFDPAVIGQIMAIITTEANVYEKVDTVVTKLVETKKAEIKKSIVEGLTKTIRRQTEHIQEKLKPLVESKAAIDAFAQDKKGYEVIKAMVTDEKKITLQKVQRFLGTIVADRTVIEDFNKLIGVRGLHLQELGQEEKNNEEIVNKHFLVNAREFGKLLQQSLQEENDNLYPRGVTGGLLLAWLWRHSNTRDDIKIYLDNVAAIAGKQPTEVIVWPLPAAYTRDNYDELKKKTVDQIESLSLDELIFARYGFDLYENPLPPIVGMSGSIECHRKDTKEVIADYSDCGETSLRNLLNAILYSIKDKEFDLNLLEKITTYGLLLKYYKKYKNAERIATLSAHNDWSDVVGGLSGVTYHDPGDAPQCNMSSGIQNMFKVIAHLIPGATSFEKLKNILGRQGITFDYSSQDISRDVNNIVTITIEKPEQSRLKLTWKFLAGHFVLEYPPLDSMEQSERYKEALTFLFSKSSDGYTRWQFIMLRCAFGMLSEELLKEETIVMASNAVLPMNLKTPEQKNEAVRVIAGALADKDQNKVEVYKNFIENIYNTLPQDTAILHPFFKNMFSNLTDQTFDMFKRLSTTSALAKKSAIYGIAQIMIPDSVEGIKLLEPLYAWVKDILPKLTDSDHIRWAANDIIRIRIPRSSEGIMLLKSLYEELPKILPFAASDTIVAVLEKTIPESSEGLNLLEILYKWVMKVLPNLERDIDKTNVIRAAVNMNIHQSREGIELLKPLYAEVKNVLPTMSEDYRVYAIKDIVKKEIPGSPEGIELLSILYQGVKDAMLTLTDDGRKTVIVGIVRKEIPDSLRGIKLLEMLYEAVKHAFAKTGDYFQDDWIHHFAAAMMIPDMPEKRVLVKILFEGTMEILPQLRERKARAADLLSRKNEIGDLLTPDQWQMVEQLAK